MTCTSLKEKIAAISANLEDHDAIWKAAHTIKGSALQCGLERLGQAAKDVERAYKEPDNYGLSQRLDFLETFKSEASRVYKSTEMLMNPSPSEAP